MIGENLQALRKRKKWTQETLAEQIGVSRQTVAKWENGESVPDLALAAKLAAAFDTTLDDLINAPIPELATPPPISGKYLFGLVTVGEKGQIVIPARARRIFHISPGDQLVVLGDEDRGLALLNSKFIMDIAEVIRHDSK